MIQKQYFRRAERGDAFTTNIFFSKKKKTKHKATWEIMELDGKRLSRVEWSEKWILDDGSWQGADDCGEIPMQ